MDQIDPKFDLNVYTFIPKEKIYIEFKFDLFIDFTQIKIGVQIDLKFNLNVYIFIPKIYK